MLRWRILCCILLACALPVAADTVLYTYDDAGRLTTVDYGNGKTIAYTYDKAGNLLSRVVTTPDSSAAAAAKAQRTSTRQRPAQETKSAPNGPR
jgi:YD repeat-containing protein